MKFVYYFLSSLLFAAVGATIYVMLQVPNDQQIKGCIRTTMFDLELCPGSKAYVPLSEISKHLQKAVVLSEDGQFWSHSGFDWASLQETAEKNREKGKIIRGGSTITQQLVKNLYLNQDKTYKRKFFEALITIKIENTLSKKEILERYLNVIEFGKEIYGVKKAAQYYFKKSPKDLDPVESAFLAMLLPNPKKYSSSFYKKELTRFAKGRISRIVGDMYRTGHLNDVAYEAAKDRMQSLFGVTYKEEEVLLEEILAETPDSAEPVDEAFTDTDLEDFKTQPNDKKLQDETVHLLREDDFHQHIDSEAETISGKNKDSEDENTDAKN